MVKGKKGSEMTIGTIVIIVLAIVVLVVLILGFSTGWKNMWSKITAFLGGGPNVDTIVQACTLACDTESKNGFCTQERTVRADNQEQFKVKNEKILNPTSVDTAKYNQAKETLVKAEEALKKAKAQTPPVTGEPTIKVLEDAVTDAKKAFGDAEFTPSNSGKATCKDLAAWYPELNFKACPGLCESA